jgi:hypothetical protein
MRRRFDAVTASRGAPKRRVLLPFTSTNTMVSPSRAMRSKFSFEKRWTSKSKSAIFLLIASLGMSALHLYQKYVGPVEKRNLINLEGDVE